MKNMLFAISLMIYSSVFGRATDEIYGNEAKSIDAIINVFYKVAFCSRHKPKTNINNRELISIQLHYEKLRW
jgi:hypothetical protein